VKSGNPDLLQPRIHRMRRCRLGQVKIRGTRHPAVSHTLPDALHGRVLRSGSAKWIGHVDPGGGSGK